MIVFQETITYGVPSGLTEVGVLTPQLPPGENGKVSGSAGLASSLITAPSPFAHLRHSDPDGAGWTRAYGLQRFSFLFRASPAILKHMLLETARPAAGGQAINKTRRLASIFCSQ